MRALGLSSISGARAPSTDQIRQATRHPLPDAFRLRRASSWRTSRRLKKKEDVKKDPRELDEGTKFVGCDRTPCRGSRCFPSPERSKQKLSGGLPISDRENARSVKNGVLPCIFRSEPLLLFFMCFPNCFYSFSQSFNFTSCFFFLLFSFFFRTARASAPSAKNALLGQNIRLDYLQI